MRAYHYTVTNSIIARKKYSGFQCKKNLHYYVLKNYVLNRGRLDGMKILKSDKTIYSINYITCSYILIP